MSAKVLFVIAYEGFRDEEYAEPRRILEENGVRVETASTRLGTAQGKLGMQAPVDRLLDQIEMKDWDGIVFIGGPGSSEYWDSPPAHALIRDAAAAGKLTAGICSAAVTLAKAGVLEKRRATVFPGDKECFVPLVGEYTAADCEVDGHFVTADGPGSAEAFGTALANRLL